MRVTTRQMIIGQPGSGITPYENACYTRARGLDMMRVRFNDLNSDIHEGHTAAYSQDNGRTWSEPQAWPTTRRTPEGLVRRAVHTGWAEPVTDRLLLMVDEALFRRDDPLEGMTNYYPLYRVSLDGGRTWPIEERVVQSGAAFDHGHPFEGVWTGRNALTIGTNPIARNASGQLLVTAQVSVLAPDGTLYCPPGAYTFTDAMVLLGTWQADGRLAWETSERIRIPSGQSWCGAIEPTLALMPDGRLLMVLRGCNDGTGTMPGRKWFCVSHDGGYSWDAPRPWGYTDGALFYSPSSYSELLAHSNGRFYWFGNIAPANPCECRPRYPLVAGEVDPHSLRLIRESVIAIDTRGEADSVDLQLSNFGLYEDRETREIVMRMTRWTPPAPESGRANHGEVHLYRIET